MQPSRALLLAVLVAPAVLAGCVNLPGGLDNAAAPGDVTSAFPTARGWSMPTSPALYEVLPGVEEIVESFDGTALSVGLFFPDIEGCDWTASELPEACHLPVVMDSGPYYADATEDVDYRPPLIEWLVPRGYVVAHMAIRGTGESAGCMEFMSLNEQKDVDHVVTWLAEQPWSNGNVGMMGRSYDGTTPFMAAALGNPHLKTIVPISGVASVPDLMFKNGTSEFRGPIMHSVVYWTLYGMGALDGGSFGHRADHWGEQACEEFVVGSVDGPATALTGNTQAEYWRVREFRDRILENYEGSVWIIHGLEDWNVNPSQVVPWINALQDAGIETHAWLGVWGHAYPDRVDEHRNVRWDWAQRTVEWFDHYLKGEGVKPKLGVEVEDSLFVWRHEESYPPRDASWRLFELGMDGLAEPGGGGSGFGVVAPEAPVTFTSEPLDSALRVAGLPRLHVEVTPTTPQGGYLFAELYDVFPDGRSVRIGWGAIDLRYHAGGNTDPATLVPGTPVTARMEFEPVDALVGEGHRLRLVVHKDGVEDILPSPDPSPVRVTIGEASALMLPAVDRPHLVPSYTPPTLAS